MGMADVRTLETREEALKNSKSTLLSYAETLRSIEILQKNDSGFINKTPSDLAEAKIEIIDFMIEFIESL